MQNEIQTKGFPEHASIKETPTNLEEIVASKNLPNKQISSELLTRPLVPNSDVPSTEIAQGVVPEKPQTNELCGDPPNEQVPNEMPKIPSTDCDANQNGNIPPKVQKSILMTDSGSDSNDSSESSSPVAEYNFLGVRQKLRSDIALKLTDIMRKKVTNNK